MTATHHPGEPWLLDYALGHLPALFDTVLRTHLGVCEQCRTTVDFCERLGGDVLGTMTAPVVRLSAADITAHYEQADADLRSPASRAHDMATADDIEQVVTTYLNNSLDAMPWRRIGGGLKLCRLAEQDDARMWLLRGEAGMVLPHHTHHGDELTLVLKGAYFCGSEIYRAGDIETADETTNHQPVITHDGECICLAVTAGRLRFRDWMPRLVQPLIGI